MDLYCPKCGEPWDNDCLHEEAEDSGRTYQEVSRDFASHGCAALSNAYGAGVADDCKASRGNARRAEISAVAFDLMGDDTDGVASMMDDAEMFGLFD